MKLFIDSSNNLKTVIGLNDNKFVTHYSFPREQNVLGAIIKALEKASKSITDISQVEVVEGPGSFTGLRVGISIANALSYALGIPINKQPKGTIIVPKYGKAPNISTPK